jgi:hypothetical protein
MFILFLNILSGSGLCRCRACRVRRSAYMTRNAEHILWTADYLGSDFTIRDVKLGDFHCSASTLRSFGG